MIEAVPNPVTTVMRALADPTRRAVFERVFESKEISVAELTRGSGVTQGAISRSAGASRWRSAARPWTRSSQCRSKKTR